MIVGLNGALALAVVALAGVGLSGGSDARAVLLVVTIVLAELAIVGVSVIDRHKVSSALTRSLDRTLMGRREQAEALLVEARPIGSEEWEVRKAKLDPARSLCNELVAEIGGEWAEALGLRAVAYLLLGANSDLEAAEQDVAKATSGAPKSMRWRLVQARVAEARGDFNRAAMHWGEANELGPDDPSELKGRLPLLVLPLRRKTFRIAFERLREAGKLASSAARSSVEMYLQALDRDRWKIVDDELAWSEQAVEAVTQALVEKSEVGWVSASGFLDNCDSSAAADSRLRRKVENLRASLVIPARSAYNARIEENIAQAEQLAAQAESISAGEEDEWT